MNQVIAEYIQKINLPWQAEICTRLDEIIHQAIPEVQERIQYGKPHYLKDGKYACVVGTAKGWVSFTIFNAKTLEAPEGFFEPGDPDRKTIKIKEGQAVDYDLLAKFIQQAASGQ
ncbi:MAG: DUF1801 domain-containing protein [Anaerolineae bacterium]|nr:DUF1801 domain-containing protein [Anaerolineae bacterium]